MVLVFVETKNGKFKKAAFEAVTYGYKTAQVLGTECVALTIGNTEGVGQLGKYGASKVYQVTGDSLNSFDSQSFTSIISEVAQKLAAQVVIINHTSTGRSLLGRLAVRLEAGSVAGVNAVPTNNGSFKVSKAVFSGKAIATYEVSSPIKVLSVMGNAIQPEEIGGEISPENIEVNIPNSKIRIKELKTEEGIVPLPEAELVVSAGRGMKGPENWGIIEELADVLGATTACSRPVADTGWRPHHEHVGQTGVAIRPNLYIAAGISGAIQHLAGVNSSKVIVVINKDPEAPFFKAADYGIVGDLFDVVPRLTESLKKFKAS
ncbi:electron transfer flavoprotein subunit alpha/FixB family protein [bacterium]|jgi:electron transfer flavoprotein alpha subunit|nr:electron transfer flavoprotein subunit alpha/FixB family protein [bacterium]MDF1864612.1 electron transfer flavoprotein subunit alpha/FixB family protein [Saprospiraceae bacterium]